MSVSYDSGLATITAANLLNFTQDVIEVTQNGYTVDFNHVNTCPQMIGFLFYAQASNGEVKNEPAVIVTTEFTPTADDAVVAEADVDEKVEKPKRGRKAE